MRPVDPRLVRTVPAVRRLLAALTGLQVLGALLTVVQAGLVADLVVGIFLRSERGTDLTARLMALAAVALARALLAAGQEWLAARASVAVRATLRARVLDAVVRLGPVAAARQQSGRLATAAGPGLEGLDGYLTRALPALVAGAVVPPVVLLRIGLADWASALVLLLVLPLVPLFMALVGVVTKRRMDRQYETLARLSGHFLDLVRGLTTLKVYGQAGRQVETVRRATDTYRRHTMSTLRAAFLSGLVLDLIATLSVAVVAVDVGLRLDHGSLDLGTALVVLLLAPELFAPLRAMGAQHHASEEGRAAAAAALDVIDEAAACPVTGGAPVGPLSGAVMLQSISLTYPGRDEAALDGVSLELAPGEIVALQGRSGAGKSSLLAVLLGFVRPSSGAVLVDGTPLAGLDADSWRRQLAWVPQRPQLTRRTVAEEVALGDPAAPGSRVDAAIAACRAPGGTTLLGEGACAVSAGQRRRIALARALLRVWRQLDAGAVPLLLLDEPSEDLDAATEEVVAGVISSLSGRATVVVASHSERLARVADRRVVVAAGRVVADERQAPTLVGTSATSATSAASATMPAASPDPGQPARPEPASSQPATVDVASVLDLRRTLRSLLGAGALSGAAGVAGLALTATSVWLICRAAQQPNVQELALAVVGVRTFALGRALLRYAERLVSHDSALRLLAEVRARVFAALEPLVPAGLGDLRRGDLLRRFVTDVDGVQEGLVRALVPLTGAVVTSVAAVVLAALLAPAAGAALAAALLAGLVGAPLLSRLVAGRADDAAADAGARDAATASFLEGQAELAAFGADRAEVAAIAGLDRRVARAARRPALGAAAGVALTGAAAALALPAALAAGAAAAGAGSLSAVSVGVLVACVLAGFDAVAPLPAAFAAWSRFRAGLDRVAELLATPAPFAEPAAPAAVPLGATGLRAAAVSLAPAAGAPPVLVGADLALCPGQRVAVVGPSGSGKSTLLAAALRLVPVSGGAVRVRRDRDAVALADLPAADVPPLVAGSLQGDHVFDASLRDNLRVVRPAATDAELDEVARRAGLAEVIAGLPQGWSTPAGPDGAALSGGQRQRLLLARALLADPEVLVLDEPTAHLDAETERAVLADLLAGTRGRTVLLSTHRRLAPGAVDAVLRLEDRQLVPA